MPNKLGLIHVRGPKLMKDKVGPEEVNNYKKFQENKLRYLTPNVAIVADDKYREELVEIGMFIEDNIKDLGNGKFLCPLSGKKFKGRDFVRKHILSRFPDQIDNVRNEAICYNNYLNDARRPRYRPNKPPVPPRAEKISLSKHLSFERTVLNNNQMGVPPPMKRIRRNFHHPDRRNSVDYNDLEIFKNPN